MRKLMKNIKTKALSIGEAMPFSKMGKSLWLLLSILFFLHSSASLAQFSATTSSTTVAVGDQFQVTFTVQGNGSNFHAPGFPDFNTLMGPNQSQSINMMN